MGILDVFKSLRSDKVISETQVELQNSYKVESPIGMGGEVYVFPHSKGSTVPLVETQSGEKYLKFTPAPGGGNFYSPADQYDYSEPTQQTNKQELVDKMAKTIGSQKQSIRL